MDWSRVPVDGHPDLAVEVISPSEYAAESLRKIDNYLKNGVGEVWQIYPTTGQILVYSASGDVKKFGVHERLRSQLLPDVPLDIGTLID